MDEKELNKAMEMPAGLQNLGDHKNDYFLANSIDNNPKSNIANLK